MRAIPSAILASSLAFVLLHSAAQHCGAVAVVLDTVGPMSPRNQAAWWSPIVTRDGAEYVSYLSTNSPQDDVFVARRTSTMPWEFRDTGMNAVYDAGHTQTSMAIDGQGYVHVAYGMHNNPMRLVTSNQPNSIAEGFSSPSGAAISAFSGGSYTYPNMTTAPNGDVYMIVRDQRSSYASQQGRLFRFNNASRAWSELPPFAGQNGTTVYPDQVLADSSGDLHILWEWAAGGAQAARHYGSYARFDPDTNSYYRADGTPFSSGPINIAAADLYQSLEGAETFTANLHGVQSAKLALDEFNRPLIGYAYSTNGTDSGYEHRFARWTGTEWVRNTVTAGPFDLDKPWIAYSQGILRYYGAVSPTNPLHTGSDDIFVRTSTNLGESWSQPVAVTNGLDIQRPVGYSVGQTDHLYLPSASAGILRSARVTWDAPLPEPPADFPYYNAFASAGLTYSSNAYSIEPASGLLHFATGGGTFVNTSTQVVSDIESSDFVLSTRLVLNHVSGGGNVISIGFGAFGSSQDFSSTGGNSFYLADWGVNAQSNQGQLRILALGDSSGFTSMTGDSDGSGPNGYSVAIDTVYELRLVGQRNGATLDLTLSLFDSEGNQIGTSATATDSSPLMGKYFGYRNRVAGTNHSIEVSYDQFSLSSPAELPGDYDGNGVVNAVDYVVWRMNLGQHVANNSSADGNGNGVINPADYDIWAARFGSYSGQVTFNAAPSFLTVPEPACGIVVAVLVVGALPSIRTTRQRSRAGRSNK